MTCNGLRKRCCVGSALKHSFIRIREEFQSCSESLLITCAGLVCANVEYGINCRPGLVQCDIKIQHMAPDTSYNAKTICTNRVEWIDDFVIGNLVTVPFNKSKAKREKKYSVARKFIQSVLKMKYLHSNEIVINKCLIFFNETKKT